MQPFLETAEELAAETRYDGGMLVFAWLGIFLPSGDDEGEHQDSEAEAPHCSRPAWSFLREISRPRAHEAHQGGSTGAGFGTQLPCGREERRKYLKTLAQDAMLSAPDKLDRLSRRSDAARNNCGPESQNRSATSTVPRGLRQ